MKIEIKPKGFDVYFDGRWIGTFPTEDSADSYVRGFNAGREYEATKDGTDDEAEIPTSNGADESDLTISVSGDQASWNRPTND